MADLAPSRDSVFRPGDHLAGLNAMSRGTAMEPLGIVFTELGDDFLRATMPVDARTKQPYGLLHGGASVLLAETLGSTAGMLSVREGEGCVGIEINANHLRGVRDGLVTGTARPLHVGRRRRCGKSASRTIAAGWCASRASRSRSSRFPPGRNPRSERFAHLALRAAHSPAAVARVGGPAADDAADRHAVAQDPCARRAARPSHDPLVAERSDARVRHARRTSRRALAGRDAVRRQPRQLDRHHRLAQPAHDGLRRQARDQPLAGGRLARHARRDHLPPARQQRIAGRRAARDARAPARGPFGRRVPRRPHPRRPRDRPVPRAHLPGRGRSRRARAAGGAALRARRERADDGRLRAGRKLRRQLPAPAGRTAPRGGNLVPGADRRRPMPAAAAASPNWRASASSPRWRRHEPGVPQA